MKHYAMSAIAVLFILVYSCSNPTNSNRGDNANKTDVVMRDSVWSNTDVPYYIKSILSIEGDVHWDKKVTVILDSNAFIEVRYGGKLTIEEGVRVIFSDKSYILVGAPYGGNIDIFGTDSLPVVLTHSQNGTYWGYESFNDFGGGIMLFGVSDTAHFNHCKFEYATNGIYANKSKLSITNCTFSNMTKSGIYCTQECQLGDSNSFRGNRFEKNKGAPIVIPANVIRCLSEDNAFTDNTTQSITVTGGMVSRSGTWKNLSYPYCFASPVDIASTDGVTITIQSGTKCLFPPNSYIRVGYNNPGALLAVGTPGNPIVFKNAVENSYWGDSLGGIVLYEKALSTSRFDYCTIERAKIGIHARASTLNFTNSKVLSCDGVGIKYSDCGVPSNSSMMSTDTIIDGQSYPIEVGAEILTSAWEPPVVSACSTKSILVSTGIIKKTGTLTIRMPYVINGVVDIGDPAGTVVKVEPATTFRFGAGGALRVGKSHSGALIAEGTSSKPILFTKDLDANWGTEQGGIILCKETNSMSSFNNCVVEYARKIILGGIFSEWHGFL